MWQKKKKMQTGAEYKTVNTKQRNLKIILWAGQNYVKSIVPKTRTFVMPFWYVSPTIHIYHKCKHAIFTRPKRNCIHIPSYFSIRNMFANIILPFAFNNCDLICNKHAQYMTHPSACASPHSVAILFTRHKNIQIASQSRQLRHYLPKMQYALDETCQKLNLWNARFLKIKLKYFPQVSVVRFYTVN